ncbi:MAG: metalloregulator ArsR/SmtB family transcription factor [Gemmatimonadetes bacterium]|nr:winged helix-turn-helix transcriptional regulator [Gemmatimonadota bacterium]NIQ57833.1 winged helix-turn-helix transcriptional regulator [Gemmatimonadota bacterium]NIU77986.1 metalloregulator ArsR/SmtB family transcription factor [Gammaproteobacteria bacterium]NIX47061.1 metalloregulator ArsR/SmtB family transcription factor [Gemmatimonadota bacterium]NIY11439.1 metalloregulator ArsR/SmtB family transcription factor [Gemmatimonadota bacterium]
MEDSQATSREVVRVLAALSDENRFRIVELLAGREGEMTCGAIGEALDISPSLLSHHLAILANAEIIGRRKKGLWTLNVLQPGVIERQLEALEKLIGRNGHEGLAETVIRLRNVDGATRPGPRPEPGQTPGSVEAPRPDDGAIAGS